MLKERQVFAVSLVVLRLCTSDVVLGEESVEVRRNVRCALVVSVLDPVVFELGLQLWKSQLTSFLVQHTLNGSAHGESIIAGLDETSLMSCILNAVGECQHLPVLFKGLVKVRGQGLTDGDAAERSHP